MMRQRVWAGLALVFVFALGAHTGIFFERRYSVPRPLAVTAAELHEVAMAELQEVLGLDERQIEQVHAVLAGRQQLVQDAWEQVRPEVQAAMQEIHAEIAALLRPEQRQLYHEWLNRQRDQSQREHVLIISH